MPLPPLAIPNPPLSLSIPDFTTPSLYCTDEDILVRAGGDWALLVPSWQLMAAGTDGVFEPNAPWVLTSDSVNFQAQSVNPNQVVQLTAPKTQYPGGGQFLAIDSVSGNSITLRRPHKDLYVGQPPAPMAGLTAVQFSISTLDPQIEEATSDLKRRFTIDERLAFRASSFIYADNLRDLRMATMLSVLLDRYTQEARTERGDFTAKVARIKQQLSEVLARVQIKWGPFGNSSEPTTLFGCKLSR
jgi:hypothetical protein